MSFEKFTDVGRSYKPKISITKSGLISFNKGSVNRFKLDDYEYAILYYDKEDSRIGVELTNDKNGEGACKLRKRSSGADISAKSFFDYFAIDYKETKRYNAEWNDKNDMIIACIEE